MLNRCRKILHSNFLFSVILYFVSIYYCFGTDEIELLTNFSLIPPYSPGNLTINWSYSKEIEVSQNALSLLPKSKNEKSYIWSNIQHSGLDFFEVDIVLHIKASKMESVVYPGFAIWLTELYHHEQHESKTFFGTSPYFTGLGIFFSVIDRSKQINPSISGSFSDGTHYWNHEVDVPTTGVYWNYRGSLSPFVMKLTSKPDENHVSLKGRFQTQNHWTDIFLLNGKLPNKFYLGFTSETLENTEIVEPDSILIQEIKSYASKPTSSSIQSENSNTNHIETYKYSDHNSCEISREFHSSISRLEEILSVKMDKINKDIQYITAHVDTLATALMDSRGPNTVIAHKVTKEIEDFKRVMQEHLQVANKVFHDTNSQNVKHLHNAREYHFEKLQHVLRKQATTNWIMLGIITISLLSFILWMWKRSRDLDKLHLF